MPRLDPDTLRFAIAAVGFLTAAIALSSARAMPAYQRPLLTWSTAMAAAGGGLLLYFLRRDAPGFFTFLLANALVMAAAVCIHRAFAQLLEVDMARRSVGLASATGLGGVLATYVFDAPRPVALVALSLAVATILGVTAGQLVRSAWIRRTPPAAIAAGITVLMSATFAMRAVVGSQADASMWIAVASGPAQVGGLLSGALFVVASSVGFFALVHERQRLATLDSVRRDGLTGVCTRSAFFELATAVALRPAAEGHAVVMVDIDHFKRINDRWGHSGGDLVLAHAGRLIAGAVRASDVVGRYGGEEFCILLQGCGEPQAAKLAQRLVREAGLQSVPLGNGQVAAYTLSAGYAVLMDHGLQGRPETLAEALERADQALYRAKRQGRNQAQAALAEHTALTAIEPTPSDPTPGTRPPPKIASAAAS